MSIELEQFGKLEKKITELIASHKSLKEEKLRCDAELRATKDKLSVLEKEIDELKNSRKDVLKRVDDLIRELESGKADLPEAGEPNGPAA